MRRASRSQTDKQRLPDSKDELCLEQALLLAVILACRMLAAFVVLFETTRWNRTLAQLEMLRATHLEKEFQANAVPSTFSVELH